MLTLFRKKTNPYRVAAEALYAKIVQDSRNPLFYADLGVPDTVDGRFDMILMHVFIVMRDLRDRTQTELSQALYDVMFVDMDRAVREMGVGDLSVKKHIRRMMTAFNGRLTAYDVAIGDRAALTEAIRRNVYGTVEGEVDPAHLNTLADYIENAIAGAKFRAQDVKAS